MTAGEVANPRPEPERKRGNFRELLKQQFRQLAQVLTVKPAQRRRKKKEETRSGFMMAARRVVSNSRRLSQQFRMAAIASSELAALPNPAADYAPATAYLWATLDWMNPYQPDDSGLNEDCQLAPQEHLYPHL